MGQIPDLPVWSLPMTHPIVFLCSLGHCLVLAALLHGRLDALGWLPHPVPSRIDKLKILKS